MEFRPLRDVHPHAGRLPAQQVMLQDRSRQSRPGVAHLLRRQRAGRGLTVVGQRGHSGAAQLAAQAGGLQRQQEGELACVAQVAPDHAPNRKADTR